MKKKKKRTRGIKNWILNLAFAVVTLVILKVMSYFVGMTLFGLAMWTGLILVMLGGILASNNTQWQARNDFNSSLNSPNRLPNQDFSPKQSLDNSDAAIDRYSFNMLIVGFFIIFMGIALNVF